MFRAGVDCGELVWAKGSRAALGGHVESSWRSGSEGFQHNITVPVSVVAKVSIPAERVEDVMEGGTLLDPAGATIKVLGRKPVNGIPFVDLRVESGSYSFSSSWRRSGQNSELRIWL